MELTKKLTEKSQQEGILTLLKKYKKKEVKKNKIIFDSMKSQKRRMAKKLRQRKMKSLEMKKNGVSGHLEDFNVYDFRDGEVEGKEEVLGKDDKSKSYFLPQF